jgi:hypothetical protein
VEYKISVLNREDRVVRIAQEKTPGARTAPFVFRGKPITLDVVRLPIEIPIYRMDNGRTRLKQAEYFLHHKLPSEYFLKSEEDVSAQQIQHTILLELARDPRGPIYDELLHQAAQTEALLATAAGVVVNGNRRLAAMRHLVVNEGEQFREYNFVDLAILPAEATIEDIEEIESELQEIPETKLEYDWISRRLKLRYRRDVLRFSSDRLVKMYRFKGKEDVNRELQQLQLAEEYLDIYLKKPGEYELVEQSEEIVRQLQAALENKTPEMAEMSKLVAFPLMKEARGLGSRAYEFRTAFGADLEEVLSRVAEREKISIGPPTSPAVDPDDASDDDPLSGLAERTENRFVALRTFLLDTGKSKDVAAKLVRISSAVREEKREGGRKLVALKNAEAANRIVHEIDLNGADPQTFSQIAAQLESCIVEAEKIRRRISEIQSEKSKS